MIEEPSKGVAAKEAGFALIEAVVALSVFLIGFTGLITLLSQSTRFTSAAAQSYTATYLAAEGIEVMKNVIDANHIQGNPWNCGLTLTSGIYRVTYSDAPLTSGTNPTNPDCNQLFTSDSSCSTETLRYQSDGTYSYNSAGAPTNFTRCMSINLIQSDLPATTTYNEVQVVSTVGWTTLGQNYSVSLEDHFFNWRP